MKSIFKSTALSASRRAGPLQDFYAGLLARGMNPEVARLTLARKIAASQHAGKVTLYPGRTEPGKMARGKEELKACF